MYANWRGQSAPVSQNNQHIGAMSANQNWIVVLGAYIRQLQFEGTKGMAI